MIDVLRRLAEQLGAEVPNGYDVAEIALPGGCDHCDALQVMTAPETAGVYRIDVRHDDDCPWWIDHQERTARRAAHFAARRRYQ